MITRADRRGKVGHFRPLFLQSHGAVRAKQIPRTVLLQAREPMVQIGYQHPCRVS
jgi:hypothetical protein